MGAQALDELGKVIGMAGQGGQVYFRTEKEQGFLNIRWGDSEQQRCRLPFNISDMDTDKALIRLSSFCIR